MGPAYLRDTAGVMYLTRNVDWYRIRLGHREAETAVDG